MKYRILEKDGVYKSQVEGFFFWDDVYNTPFNTFREAENAAIAFLKNKKLRKESSWEVVVTRNYD